MHRLITRYESGERGKETIDPREDELTLFIISPSPLSSRGGMRRRRALIRGLSVVRCRRLTLHILSLRLHRIAYVHMYGTVRVRRAGRETEGGRKCTCHVPVRRISCNLTVTRLSIGVVSCLVSLLVSFSFQRSCLPPD